MELLAAEITDAHHVAASAAVAAGDLSAAHTAIQRARVHDPAGDHPYLSTPRLVRLLALSGRFDEATDAAQDLWDSWLLDGEPPMAWMSSALAAAALVHGLRDGEYELWRSRALTVAGADTPTGSPDLMAFVDVRIAIHTDDVDHALAPATPTPSHTHWRSGTSSTPGSSEPARCSSNPTASPKAEPS